MKTNLLSFAKTITTTILLFLNYQVYSCDLVASLETMTPPTCFNGTNGSVSISLSGDAASSNGSYTVDDQQQVTFSTNPFTVNGLSPGIHSITIFTVTECSVTLPFEVLNAQNIDDNNACTTDACNTATGAIIHSPVNVNDNNACTVDG